MTIENVKAFVDECVKNLEHCEHIYEMQTLRDKAFGVCDFAVRFCDADLETMHKIREIWLKASAMFDWALYKI